MMSEAETKTLGICCPIFHAEKWDEKTHQWREKLFLKESVPTLFHIPYRPMLGRKIRKLMQQAEVAKRLAEDREDILLLFSDPSPFKSELFLSVTGEVPTAKEVGMTGSFVSKVFDGPYQDTRKFIDQMNTYLADQGKSAKQLYVHYAYCPKCAREAGHNYMVLFAEI